MKPFESLLPQPLYHRLEQLGLVEPTPIQAQAIPLALEGADILGSAQTGTGKTAAFGVPLITHLLNNENGHGLILLPTRELASQVMETMEKFIGSSKIKTALLIGGAPIGKQINKLKAKPRLIVGTPGRINDHLRQGTLKLKSTDFMVLDEVDRMLDMGFGVQLDEIAKHLGENRQTLMFSATMPKNINNIAAKYLTEPTRIEVGSTRAPTENVKIETVNIPQADKLERLVLELKERNGSVIIFVKTKHLADRLADKLKKHKYKTDSLHGDLRQNKRTQVVNNFRDMKFQILVATDVAARGLDISHIEHVINYDMPQNPEDYIHRIGRTGRAGAKGHALNFVTKEDKMKWRAISRLLNPDEPMPDGEDDGFRKPKRPKKRPFIKANKRNGNREDRRSDDRRGGRNEGKPSKPSGSKKPFRSKEGGKKSEGGENKRKSFSKSGDDNKPSGNRKPFNNEGAKRKDDGNRSAKSGAKKKGKSNGKSSKGFTANSTRKKKA